MILSFKVNKATSSKESSGVCCYDIMEGKAIEFIMMPSTLYFSTEGVALFALLCVDGVSLAF